MAILQEDVFEDLHPRATKGRAATNGRVTLGRTTLLREVYRSLINTGRTYAAFRDEDRVTVARLIDRSPILDPMSGYGGLAALCAELGIRSFGVKYNPAQYFWQLLSHPGRADIHLRAIAAIIRRRRSWPRPRNRAVVSDEFFPDETRVLLTRLFSLIQTATAELPLPSAAKPWEVPVSLLLPFSGRLACTSPGDVSTHTKEGGTCVLLGWQDDFYRYLNALSSRLESIKKRSMSINHDLVLGDARAVDLGKRRFRSMFTSPPYPNHRDFSTILLPENMLLGIIGRANGFDVPFARESIIGSNFVKGSEFRSISSSAANRFMSEALALRRNKRAEYDDKVYYIPYFRNYFSSLEAAYRNIATYLHTSFEGYVVVVNNTHRGIVIPVSEVVQDIWRSVGFHTEVSRATESFHLGAKNPRAKGIRARHTEYVVRIWR
jgi:hypothetical protein